MKLTFTDTQERNYVLDGKNLHAEPGKEYELDSDPGDGRWSGGDVSAFTSLQSAAPPVSTQTVPQAVSEPSTEQGA
jgi:hypothetical protein